MNKFKEGDLVHVRLHGRKVFIVAEVRFDKAWPYWVTSFNHFPETGGWHTDEELQLYENGVEIMMRLL